MPTGSTADAYDGGLKGTPAQATPTRPAPRSGTATLGVATAKMGLTPPITARQNQSRSPGSPLDDDDAGSSDSLGTVRISGRVLLPDRRFGFSIRGGSDKPDGGVFITDIRAGGNLDRDGRFADGDRIELLNSVAVAGLTHAEVLAVVKQNRDAVSLEVVRQSDTMSSTRKDMYNTAIQEQLSQTQQAQHSMQIALAAERAEAAQAMQAAKRARYKY